MSAIQQVLAALKALPSQGQSVAAWDGLPAGASEVYIRAINYDGSRYAGMRTDSGTITPWMRLADGSNTPVVSGSASGFDNHYFVSTDATMIVGCGDQSIDPGVISLWDGVTLRTYSALAESAESFSVLAISPDGNCFAAQWRLVGDIVVTRIYSGAKTYVATGSGLTYVDIDNPAGVYATAPDVQYVANSGASYAQSRKATSKYDLLRAGATGGTLSVIQAESIDGYSLFPDMRGADSVLLVDDIGFMWTYSPSEGLVDILLSGYTYPTYYEAGVQATGEVYNGTSSVAALWTPTGGWVTLDQIPGSSPYTYALAGDGAATLCVGTPDDNPYVERVYRYVGGNYTPLPMPPTASARDHQTPLVASGDGRTLALRVTPLYISPLERGGEYWIWTPDGGLQAAHA